MNVKKIENTKIAKWLETYPEWISRFVRERKRINLIPRKKLMEFVKEYIGLREIAKEKLSTLPPIIIKKEKKYMKELIENKKKTPEEIIKNPYKCGINEVIDSLMAFELLKQIEEEEKK